MSTEQALEYALSEEEPPPPPEPRRAPDYLTRREREVATLAAQGFTNHRIAAELSISEYTVANHLRSILKKLGLRSRAQIPSRL
ncbi:LuxR family transcriptional regulator [Rubrobacter taiwanensis]|uniref:LuxR family transcriptional regulator n=2 Tax=Rubrobacter taiwanensis TaxID=185139 RepID=A0A4R1BMF3_9ACTN|nr:LuxR family transcriptional regulator [Rubrobacter taiwanensis]